MKLGINEHMLLSHNAYQHLFHIKTMYNAEILNTEVSVQ
jgi:hypothetical protein